MLELIGIAILRTSLVSELCIPHQNHILIMRTVLSKLNILSKSYFVLPISPEYVPQRANKSRPGFFCLSVCVSGDV